MVERASFSYRAIPQRQVPQLQPAGRVKHFRDQCTPEGSPTGLTLGSNCFELSRLRHGVTGQVLRKWEADWEKLGVFRGCKVHVTTGWHRGKPAPARILKRVSRESCQQNGATDRGL